MFNALNPALVLVCTLLLWLPTLRNLLAGNLNVSGAVVRFGLALGVSWLANDVVRRVLRVYARHNATKHAQEARAQPRPADRPGTVLAELRERPPPESRLARRRDDPANGPVSRLKR
jgi:hypothetical protein